MEANRAKAAKNTVPNAHQLLKPVAAPLVSLKGQQRLRAWKDTHGSSPHSAALHVGSSALLRANKVSSSQWLKRTMSRTCLNGISNTAWGWGCLTPSTVQISHPKIQASKTIFYKRWRNKQACISTDQFLLSVLRQCRIVKSETLHQVNCLTVTSVIKQEVHRPGSRGTSSMCVHRNAFYTTLLGK